MAWRAAQPCPRRHFAPVSAHLGDYLHAPIRVAIHGTGAKALGVVTTHGQTGSPGVTGSGDPKRGAQTGTTSVISAD